MDKARKEYSDFVKLMTLMSEVGISRADEDADRDELKPYSDKVRTCIRKLHLLKVSDISANICVIDIANIYEQFSSKKEVRAAVCRILIAEGILKIFGKFWDECYENTKALYSNAGRVKFANLYALKIILQNYADAGMEMAFAYFENGDIIKRLVKELNMLELNIPTLSTNDKLQTMIIANFAILHNAVRNDNRNRIHIRENDGVKTMFAYAKSELMIVKARAFIVLAYCVDEEEYSNLADYGVVDFILTKLRSAASSRDHRATIGSSGFSAVELIMALNKLASNEQNKKSMVEAGVLPILAELLQGRTSTHAEHLKCVNFLWSLAYHEDNKRKIIEEPGLMELIKQLRKINSISDELKQDIQSLMLVLGIERLKRSQSVVKRKHIMLSYNWEVKEVIRELKRFLQTAGQKVWIDVDDLHGNMNDGMSEAVENSALVVAAMTQSYKGSNSCRQELEYAHDRNIPILPLLLQPGYKPDGWLGLLVVKKKYVDLSSPDNLPQKFRDVLSEIRSLLTNDCQTDGATSSVRPPVATSRQSALAFMKAVLPCQSWSVNEVQSWCSEIGIKDLQHYDGEDLSELCKVMVRCPDEYYRVLQEELHLNFKEKSKLSKALARFL